MDTLNPDGPTVDGMEAVGAYLGRATDGHRHRFDGTPCTEQHASEELLCLRVRPSLRKVRVGKQQVRTDTDAGALASQ